MGVELNDVNLLDAVLEENFDAAARSSFGLSGEKLDQYCHVIDEEIDGLSYKYPQRQKSSINNKESLLSFSSDDELEKKSSRKVSKDSNGCKKKKFQRRKSKGKTCKLKKPNCLKIISILKERNTEGRKRSCTIHIKRVQFGTVTFSY